MPSSDQIPGPDEKIQLQIELLNYGSPEKRIDFLKEHGINHHFLVSGPELAAIQAGTDKLHAEIRKWRTLAQATHGVSDPERALEVTQQQARHRKGIADDRMRYREALMKILQIAKGHADSGEAGEFSQIWELAKKAVNNE